MDLQLDDKTALVTGSTAGIGFAIAVGLAREGATVFLNGRSRQRVEDARERLLAEVPGADIELAPGDLATSDGAQAVVDTAPDVDIVVHNAAIYEPTPFAEIPDEEWSRFFDTNVLSGVRLGRHYLTKMLERDSGRIIFIGSDSSLTAQVAQLHYSVSKAAALALSRGLAEMTSGSRVTVNTVLPSVTITEGFHDIARDAGMTVPEFEAMVFTDIVPSSILQRGALPEEVAHVVVFLASPLAALTNGAAVRADGGTLRSFG